MLNDLLKRSINLSGPLKKGDGVLYGTYHFKGLDSKNQNAMRNTLKRYNFFGIPKSLDGLNVLDLGSNTGALSLEASRRGASVFGLEYNQERVDLCTEIAYALDLENIEFKQCDFNKDWSLDKTFDIVFCCAVDRYLNDKNKLFESVKKYTKSICYLEVNSPGLKVNYVKDFFQNDFNVDYIGELDAGRKNFILSRDETSYPVYCLNMVPISKCKTWKEYGYYYKKLRTKRQYDFIKHQFQKINHPNILKINFLEDNIISSEEIKNTTKWEAEPKYCRQLASAIEQMNFMGFSHGDLMPKNLLIKDQLYIIDFELMFPDVCGLLQSVDVVGLNSMHYGLGYSPNPKPDFASSETAFEKNQRMYLKNKNIIKMI